MLISPDRLTELAIRKVSKGLYAGFNRSVAIGAMTTVLLLILWILLTPETATRALSDGKFLTLALFRGWYMYALAAFVVFCLVVVALPVSGRIRLGPDGSRPEYSTGSWLSMMFCSGIGAGVLIYAVSEPLSHFAVNPTVNLGHVEGGSAGNAHVALSYTYLHWGLSAWACYGVLGLAIALYSYRYGMPLTIRTGLAPLLGRSYSGLVGNLIDISSIFAIIVGVATTLGYGVAQFVSGAHNVTGAAFLVGDGDEPALSWQLAALGFAALVATGSVVSGVGRGIKWLSNISTGLFFLVLAGFALIGDFGMALSRFANAMWTYVTGLPRMATLVATPDRTAAGDMLASWQTDWTIFYWTWWIAFAPFVALFLARVSRGRSLRAFVVGCLFTPVGICMVWFAFVGGAAIDVQLNPAITSDLTQTPISAQIYETIRHIAPANIGPVWNGLVALLLMMLLITTMNAAILAINTIAAAGDETRRVPFHVVTWGVAVTVIIACLVAAGGTDSIRDAMIIGALPFSFVIALAGVSTILSIAFETGARTEQPATAGRSGNS